MFEIKEILRCANTNNSKSTYKSYLSNHYLNIKRELQFKLRKTRSKVNEYYVRYYIILIRRVYARSFDYIIYTI